MSKNETIFSCLSTFCTCNENECQLSRIIPIGSPVLTVYYKNTPINITIDSGATTSFITKKLCNLLKVEVVPCGKLIRLGDGCTTLAALGEIDVVFSRDKWSIRFRAIVVEKLSSDLYGGMTFLLDNDISLRPKTGEIKILNKHVVFQTNTLMLPPQVRSMESSPIILELKYGKLLPEIETLFVNVPSNSKDIEITNFAQIDLPGYANGSFPGYNNSNYVLIEPCEDNDVQDWPKTQLCRVKEDVICVKNDTNRVLSIPTDVHKVSITQTEDVGLNEIAFDSSNYTSSDFPKTDEEKLKMKGIENANKIDLSRVPQQLRKKVQEAHIRYSNVFIPDLTTGYNGFSGRHQVRLQFADENRPMMNKCKIPKWAGKMDDVKQRKMDSLEAQNVLVDPYKHDIKIKMISPCFLRVKARAKEKELTDCDLSEIRWIISPTQLNPHLRQLQTKNVTKEDMFIFKTEKPYCVEFDMFDGYFQNHINKEDWGYLGVETPYKGIRVLTRSGQGLLNQEIEMNQLLTKVLGVEIQKGNVMIQADDGQVGGKSVEEALENWIQVLKLCSENNIKLGYNKVKILPEVSLIHGWVFKDGHIHPDPHRKLALTEMKPPNTVGEMRTFMGVYKTFFPAIPKLSNMMAPFEKLCAGKDSKLKIEWNGDLEENFKVAKKAADNNIRNLALPHPDEQLFIVPDAACRDSESKKPALGFILFVHREPQAEPVMFVSWRMGDEYWLWSPCDLEGLGASIAVEKCSFFILRSNKPTLVFPDNKCVIQAFEKLKKGRYSTSQRLATFTNKMQRYPVILQHGSGKLLQNIGSDYISRNAPECCESKCASCEFAKESGRTILAQLSSLMTRKHPELDLKESFSIMAAADHGNDDPPLGNKKAWLELQKNDKAISEAVRLKKSGQQPPKSAPNLKEIKFYVSNCVISPSTNLLVKEDLVPYKSKPQEKIIVPQIFLEPLLIQLHHDMNCPASSQLKKQYERYFYAFQPKDIFNTVSSYCRKCTARKVLPKEVKNFKSITNARGPGIVFVVDIMKRAKQNIMVTRDAFSDYVTTAILASETGPDLKEGIISTTSSIRSSSSITIRCDNAPGFQSITKHEDLNDLGISVELSDSKNKNGVAIVDKAIQELQKELVILSPEGTKIDSKLLAKATMALNSRIRNRDLSAHEIMFCREQNTGENFKLDDEVFADRKTEMKRKNHKYSEKAKFGQGNESMPPKDLKVGDFVHIKEERDKHKLRDRYLVKNILSGEATLLKLLHSEDSNTATKFSRKEITVQLENIYKADNFTKVEHKYSVPAEKEGPAKTDHPPALWRLFPEKCITSSESSLEGELMKGTFPGSNEAHGSIEAQIINENVSQTGANEDLTTETIYEDRQMHSGHLDVPMYDDNEMPFIDGRLIQRPPPKKGDTIYFFHHIYLKWVKAILVSNQLKGYKDYFNIQYEDGSKDGLYLRQNERWTLWGDDNVPFNRVITLENFINEEQTETNSRSLI